MKAILTVVAAGVLSAGGALGQGNPVREYVYLGGRALAVDNMPIDGALTATPNVINFGAGQSTATLTITGPLGAVWWLTSEGPSWLTGSVNGGAYTDSFGGTGPAVVTLKAAQNTGPQRWSPVSVGFYRNNVLTNTMVYQSGASGQDIATATASPSMIASTAGAAAYSQNVTYTVSSSSATIYWVEFLLSWGQNSGESCNIALTSNGAGGYPLYFQGETVWSYASQGLLGSLSGTASNSECSVASGSISSNLLSGATFQNFSITIPYTLQASYQGRHEMWVVIHTSTGDVTYLAGTWTIPETSQTVPRVLGPVPAPTSSTTKHNNSYVADVRSDNGYKFIPLVDFSLNDSLAGLNSNSCYARFTRPNLLILYDWRGTYWGWTGTASIGDTSAISNSYCQLNPGASSVAVVDPNTMRVTFDVTWLGAASVRYWNTITMDQDRTWSSFALGSYTESPQ